MKYLQNKGKLNITEGSLSKNIFLFSVPLMLSNLLQVLFNMADIAVVGRFAGAEALGSVGSTSTLILLFTGVLIGLAAGVNVVAAFFIGAKKHRELEEAVHTSFVLCLLFALFVTALSEIFAKEMLSLMQTKSILLSGAVLYFRIYMLSLPALSLYNWGNALLSATGDTKRPLIFLSIAGSANIVLNLFFVIVCKMGVAGVAIASVIAQYISALLILITLSYGACENMQFFFSKIKINANLAHKIIKIGIPSGFQYAIFAFANIFIQSGVNSFDASMVAGNAASANADPLAYDIMAAFYAACASFIAQNAGAKKRDRVLKSYFLSMGYAFFTGLLIGLLLYVFGRQFLSLFATDESVIQAGMKRLRIMALSYCVSAFMDCSIAASRGLGKTLVPSIIVILGSCVFRIVWLYTVFAYFKTIESLFLLYVFSWTITAIAEIIYFVIVFRDFRQNRNYTK